MKRVLLGLILAAGPAVLAPSWAAEPVATIPATEPGTAPATAPATGPATAPATAPATGPATAPTTMSAGEGRYGRGGGRGLPADYEILDRKSIFAKDRMRRDRRGFDGGYVAARAVQPPVFIGAVLEDSGCVGFVENGDTGQLLLVHRNDKLPNNGGTVAEVTLDYLDIAVEGDSPATPPRRIAVGQNLLGLAPAPHETATTVPTTLAAATEPSGADGGAASPAPATSGAPDDLIERMRRRRLQELGK